MFNFKIYNGTDTILERVGVAPQVVIAALQILGEGETLTVSIVSNPKK